MTIIQDSIRSERRVTYGLILRRKAGQCLVMDGPSRLFFLHGECEALVIQQSEPSQPKNVGTTDNSIEISGPAIVVFIAGGGRVGIKRHAVLAHFAASCCRGCLPRIHCSQLWPAGMDWLARRRCNCSRLIFTSHMSAVPRGHCVRHNATTDRPC